MKIKSMNSKFLVKDYCIVEICNIHFLCIFFHFQWLMAPVHPVIYQLPCTCKSRESNISTFNHAQLLHESLNPNLNKSKLSSK